MKHLYFVRHGESLANQLGIHAGISEAPLTPLGKAQATALGKKLRAQGLVFDVILSSPLERAHHTALEIAEHINYPSNLIEINDDLVERNFGAMESKGLYSDFGVSNKDYIDNPFSIDHISNVEKITDLQYRANRVLEYLRSRPENSILVVGHGAFGRSLQRSVINAPLTEPVAYLKNADILKLI